MPPIAHCQNANFFTVRRGSFFTREELLEQRCDLLDAEFAELGG